MRDGSSPERGRTALVLFKPAGKSGRTAPRPRDCRPRRPRGARRAECLHHRRPRGRAASLPIGGSAVDTVHPRCAGLDVHKDTVVACVRHHDGGKRARQEVRTFATHTRALEDLAHWLAAEGVTHAAMESTGVYWKPVFNVLEGRVAILLVNAQHIKQVPGRKTDVADCAWIAQLLQHGLLRASFIPPARQRELRDLTLPTRPAD